MRLTKRQRWGAVLAAGGTLFAAALMAGTAGASQDRTPVAGGDPREASGGPHQKTNAQSTSAECSVEQLPDGGSQTASLSGGDPTGKYLIGSDGNGAEYLWVDGGDPVEIKGPTSEGEELTGVNSSGVVTGYGYQEPYGLAFTWKDGQLTELTTDGDSRGFAEGINENGDVLGRDGGWTGVVWSAGGDPDQPEPVAGTGTESDPLPYAISDDGAMVGNTYFDSPELPYYWADKDSEPQELPLPDGVTTATADEIVGDWAIGGGEVGEPQGFRWNLADGTVEELPNYVGGVNSQGDIGVYGTDHATLQRADGSTVELPGPDGATQVAVTAVFEPGSTLTAAGWYGTSDDNTYPVTWTCESL